MGLRSLRNGYRGAVSSAVASSAALLLAGAPGPDAASAQPTTPSFTYSHDPADLIARIRIRAGEIRGPQSRTASVYGDGRVVVEFPASFKKPGRHETSLDPAELDDLVTTLVVARLPEFDADLVRAAVDAEQATRADVAHVADADVVEIELYLDAYQQDPAVPSATLEKYVTWRALSQDAARFPGVTALADLVTARDALALLMARSDLEAVP